MSDITYVCADCGSDSILWDAYAIWDHVIQEMVLHSTYEDTRCNECGATDWKNKSELVEEKEIS